MIKEKEKNIIDKTIEEFNSSKEINDQIPVNIVEKIKEQNIELNELCYDLHDEVLGEIKKENGKYKINIQGYDFSYRRRFTMAHELGHYILHKDLLDEEGLDDGLSYETMYRKNAKISSQHEIKANQYAIELLVPKQLIERIVSSLNKIPEIHKIINENGEPNNHNLIEYLSDKFQVSKIALTFRLKNISKNLYSNN
jgi:Zn-dependent peptidase ImmA (M78 family)